MFEALHGMKKGLKDFVAPQGMFEDLGIKYVGPVDGHNIEELEFALQRARDFGAPVIVHAITEKGRGYKPAELDDAEKFHAVGVVDPDNGKPLKVSGPTWTNVFSEELVNIGSRRQDVVAITAAMLGPTGLDKFKANFPNRTFDVGIAEQHAVTSAVGMSHAGLHPVVAIYSTFLNRAIDQVIMDCAMHEAGVTFVLDRAGVTGDDGPSHNGMWDMALLRVVPNLELAAPRDGEQLKIALNRAMDKSDHPTVVRFPKGVLGKEVTAVRQLPFGDLLLDAQDPDVTIVSIGALAGAALEAAQILTSQGYLVSVIDPVWAYPVNQQLVTHLATSSLVITVEDGLVSGGVGDAIAAQMRNQGLDNPVLNLGIPKEFLRQANRGVLLAEFGLDAQGIAKTVRARLQATVG
jgi:1-deoxy-D-xylulose-5-phosphate synthase